MLGKAASSSSCWVEVVVESSPSSSPSSSLSIVEVESERPRYAIEEGDASREGTAETLTKEEADLRARELLLDSCQGSRSSL